MQSVGSVTNVNISFVNGFACIVIQKHIDKYNAYYYY